MNSSRGKHLELHSIWLTSCSVALFRHRGQCPSERKTSTPTKNNKRTIHQVLLYIIATTQNLRVPLEESAMRAVWVWRSSFRPAMTAESNPKKVSSNSFWLLHPNCAVSAVIVNVFKRWSLLIGGIHSDAHLQIHFVEEIYEGHPTLRRSRSWSQYAVTFLIWLLTRVE